MFEKARILILGLVVAACPAHAGFVNAYLETGYDSLGRPYMTLQNDIEFDLTEVYGGSLLNIKSISFMIETGVPSDGQRDELAGLGWEYQFSFESMRRQVTGWRDHVAVNVGHATPNDGQLFDLIDAADPLYSTHIHAAVDKLTLFAGTFQADSVPASTFSLLPSGNYDIWVATTSAQRIDTGGRILASTAGGASGEVSVPTTLLLLVAALPCIRRRASGGDRRS